MYDKLIAKAIGATYPPTVKVVEEIMRVDRSGLDGLSTAEFVKEARTAYKTMLLLERVGVLAEFCEAFDLQLPVRI